MQTLTMIFERMKRMFLKDTRAIGTPPAATQDMMYAAQSWMDLFRGKAPWLLRGTVHSLQLPASIAGELARLVTVELHASITGSQRADFLQAQLAPVMENLRAQVEYALAGGGLVMKPYLSGTGLAVDFVHANQFIPTAWNDHGAVTGATFLQRVTKPQGIYTRCEHHSLTAQGYTISNEAYFSHNEQALGTRVALSSVDEWAQLVPESTLVYADGSVPCVPLFAYFKLPFANQAVPASPIGVSAYSRAVDLIEQADLQYSRILWEFEGSELAVDASVGALQTDDGRLRMPRTRERLFRELSIDKGDGGDLYSVFSPTIRDTSLFNGLNQLLKRIEFACYLSYGTLSDPQSVEKTAEEIKMSRQRSYSAVCDMQKSLAGALHALLGAMDLYASLYHLAPEGTYDAQFHFGDAIVTDTLQERTQMRQDCLDGAAAWWEYRMRFYGESEDVAKARTGFYAASAAEAAEEVMAQNPA